jgi:hypothetical protein
MEGSTISLNIKTTAAGGQISVQANPNGTVLDLK